MPRTTIRTEDITAGDSQYIWNEGTTSWDEIV